MTRLFHSSYIPFFIFFLVVQRKGPIL
uniref:Phospholipid-transporting ATPase n=1 Tax=Rhizophora mucronata TaxID=61149 RepID=A0A2P2N6F7_RHIMU